MKFQQKVETDWSSFPKVCEECGKEFMIKDGFALACQWLVTGHPAVGAFPCEQTERHENIMSPTGPHHTGQHWGCCPDHAIKVTIECLQGTMKDQLLTKHNSANAPKEMG